MKKPVATYTTKAMARVYRRTLTESGDNDCDYANSLNNPNNATLVGGYVLHAETPMTTITGTSWTSLTTSFVNPATTDGLQIQIRAYGKSLTNTGATGSIRFDNVRADGT